MATVTVPSHNVTVNVRKFGDVAVRPENVRVVSVETGKMGPPGPQGPQGPQGIQGPEGEPGSGVSIYGALADVSELPQDPAPDEAYLINGDLYVFHDGSWTNAGNIQGPQGEPGPMGPEGPEGPVGPADTFFHVHSQDNPANVWTVQHNLGGYPSTTVIDSGGTVVEGDVVYLNDVAVEITFNSSFAGKAYFS